MQNYEFFEGGWEGREKKEERDVGNEDYEEVGDRVRRGLEGKLENCQKQRWGGQRPGAARLGAAPPLPGAAR